MITLIEALNYRSLRYVKQPLGKFHVLIGPNASGKSTFLDVLAFLGRLVSDGLEAAVNERTQNFQDLVWNRKGNRFELAIEVEIPEAIRTKLSKSLKSETIEVDEDSKITVFSPQLTIYNTVRYEVAIEDQIDGLVIAEEQVLLKKATSELEDKASTNGHIGIPKSIFTKEVKDIKTTALKKAGQDVYFLETGKKNLKKFELAFNFGSNKSVLGNLPVAVTKFPAFVWLKELLSDALELVKLDIQKIRKPSPYKARHDLFKGDGSNLAWVIQSLKENHKADFYSWIAHVQTALPDIDDIRTVLEEDQQRFFIIQYRSGLEVPSWGVSEGTLRMLALTVLAYIPDLKGVYLIEEPENVIHPRAIETVFEALGRVYDAQVLLVTHSPVMLNLADINDILIFTNFNEKSVEIVTGDKHPMLSRWQGNRSAGELFTLGVFGY